MLISFRLPRIPAGAWSNLLGLFGLLAIVAAVGGLTGNPWWAVLTGGLIGVGLATMAQLAEQRTAPAPRAPAAAASGPRPEPVAEAAP